MKILLFALIFFIAWLLGVFGFCQIVGTLKYFTSFSTVSALSTIILWLVILGLAAFAVIKWLPDQAPALYIGYGISFLLSFKTKPD